MQSVLQQEKQIPLSEGKIHSLAAANWKMVMHDFLIDCIASAPVEQEDRIREAARLFGEGRLAGFGCPEASVDPERLDAMLAAGAFESAVLSLIGDATAFMVSRGGNGTCLATAVLPDGSEEAIAEAATLALALLAAQVSALIEDAEQSGTSGGVMQATVDVRLN